MSKGFWGADETGEQKPMWPQVLRPARTVQNIDQSANTFATNSGWTKQFPWGTEVLVAIRGLADKLGVANLASLVFGTIAGTAADGSGKLVNAAAQSLTVVVGFNEPVAITDTPTLSMISSNASVANITLSYNAALSAANTTGKVVFANLNFTLASAGYVSQNLVANDSSVVTGWDGIVDLTGNVVANGVPAGMEIVVPVYQEKPVQTATTRVGTASNTVDQTIAFAIKFNEAVVLTTTPSLTAIGDGNTAPVGNLTLTYTATGSNLALGNLVFSSPVTDFSAVVNAAVYTINASSNVQNWAGIKNAIGGTVANQLIVANTFTVTVA
jgi:hypothetical protein